MRFFFKESIKCYDGIQPQAPASTAWWQQARTQPREHSPSVPLPSGRTAQFRAQRVSSPHMLWMRPMAAALRSAARAPSNHMNEEAAVAHRHAMLCHA